MADNKSTPPATTEAKTIPNTNPEAIAAVAQTLNISAEDLGKAIAIALAGQKSTSTVVVNAPDKDLLLKSRTYPEDVQAMIDKHMPKGPVTFRLYSRKRRRALRNAGGVDSDAGEKAIMNTTYIPSTSGKNKVQVGRYTPYLNTYYISQSQDGKLFPGLVSFSKANGGEITLNPALIEDHKWQWIFLALHPANKDNILIGNQSYNPPYNTWMFEEVRENESKLGELELFEAKASILAKLNTLTTVELENAMNAIPLTVPVANEDAKARDRVMVADLTRYATSILSVKRLEDILAGSDEVTAAVLVQRLLNKNIISYDSGNGRFLTSEANPIGADLGQGAGVGEARDMFVRYLLTKEGKRSLELLLSLDK